MESKKINFFLYRYHLLPLENDNNQSRLFESSKLSKEEIKEMKNDFFSKELDILDSSKKNPHPLKLHFKEENYYLFKIAQKKTAIITKNFNSSTIDNEPYVYVIINNDPTVQKIAISENNEAFSNPDVVKNMLKKTFQRDLEKHGLNIEIEYLSHETKFWEFVKRHQEELTYLSFKFIKPNLAQISSALPQDFKLFAESVNSHESQITIKAPSKGKLENINKNNTEIQGLVDYVSKGAGSIRLKVKSIRKTISTKDNREIIEAENISIEGTADQVVKVIKTII